MRIDQNKSGVEKQEIKQDVRPFELVRSEKGMVRSLTILDTIALVVLIMFQLALSHSMQIEYDNRKEKDDNA